VETRKPKAGALGITWVATGRPDGFFEQHLNASDALAAPCIATEAGASATDFLGASGLANGAPVLVSTTARYDALSLATGIR
jgi:myo-inositol-1(or 4)-monophosphatase